MTYIDERDDTIQYGIIAVFSLATLAVVAYVVFGSSIAAYSSISLFALGFIAICLFSIRKVFLVLNYKEKLENYATENSETIDDEFKEKKKNAETRIKSVKAKELTKAILSGMFAIFAIVVLVLF